MIRTGLIAALLAFAGAVFAQPYPSKTVSMVVNFPPGSAADQLDRAVAAKLREALEPVAPVASVAVFLQIKPAIPATTLSEFIAYLRAEAGSLKRSFAFATAPASAARSAAGTDTWWRLAPSPNASLQLLFLNASAMYNTGAAALPSVAWVVGFIFRFPSLHG